MIDIAGRRVSVDEARLVISGYAFGSRLGSLRPPAGPAYGELPETAAQPRWAYRSYDCVGRGGSATLQDVDVLAAAGLNAELNAGRVAGLLRVRHAVDPALAKIDEGTTFWGLPTAQIATSVHIPEEHSQGWWMMRAWWVCMSVPDIGATITHKVLHHKRPAVFPLLDSLTMAQLPEGRRWRTIHDDLNAGAASWRALETWFASEADRRNGVPLSRLRLYDILLWSWASAQWDEARAAGQRHGSRGMDGAEGDAAAELPLEEAMEPWSEPGLTAQGFLGFVPFRELPTAQVPARPGVYVVVRRGTAPAAFQETSRGGHFKGKDPTVTVEVLRKKWVAGASVVYIGKANDLRRRLSEFRRYGEGLPVGHQGGRYIWQLADADDLMVAWMPVGDDDPEAVEATMLSKFVSAYGALPFANLR